MGEPLVVPAIRSGDVSCGQGSSIRLREDALQPLDFGNGLFSVHPYQSHEKAET